MATAPIGRYNPPAVLPSLNIALLTNLSPSKLGDELTRVGYNVFEAISASEVLGLCDDHVVDVVVVEAGVVDPELHEVQARCITVLLEPKATVAEIMWELSLLFPTVTPVQ